MKRVDRNRNGSFLLIVSGFLLLAVLLVCLFVLRQNFEQQASVKRRNYDIGHALSIKVKSGETVDFHLSFLLNPNDGLYASIVNGRYDSKLESSVEETLSNATFEEITTDRETIEDSIQDRVNESLGTQAVSGVSITRALVWIG